MKYSQRSVWLFRELATNKTTWYTTTCPKQLKLLVNDEYYYLTIIMLWSSIEEYTFKKNESSESWLDLKASSILFLTLSFGFITSCGSGNAAQGWNKNCEVCSFGYALLW